MALPEVNSQIVDVVKRHCGGRNVAGLVRKLQTGSVTENEILDQLVTFCQTVLSRDEVPSVLLEMGDLLKATGEMQKAEEMYSLVLSADKGSSHAPQSSVHRAEAFMRRGEVHSCLGRWRESHADLTRSRSLFDALKEKTAVGRVDNILGTNYAEQGNTALALRFFQKAYAAFEESEEKDMTGTVLMNLGIVLNICGQYDEALGQYRRAQSCFERLGDMRRLAQLHHNMGMTYLQRGQSNDAVKEFSISYFLASKHNLVPVMASALFGKANVFYKQPDLSLALKLSTQALAMFEKCGDRLGQADAYKLKGMIHRDLKQFVLATSYFQTSLRLNTELDNKLNAAETHFEVGVMEKRRRKKPAALKAFTEALTLFRLVGAREEIKKADHEIRTLNGGTHAS